MPGGCSRSSPCGEEGGGQVGRKLRAPPPLGTHAPPGAFPPPCSCAPPPSGCAALLKGTDAAGSLGLISQPSTPPSAVVVI